MKPRELISYAIILVLIALLYRTCQKPISDHPNSIQADTAVRVRIDTFEKKVPYPVPYAVLKYVSKPDTFETSNIDSFESPNLGQISNDCDSIRYYSDSTGNERSKAVVNSTVCGVLLGQDIKLITTLNDSTFTRVITKAYPYKYQFTPFVSASLQSGTGAGATFQMDRLSLGYTYYLNKSNEIRVGYCLFRK